jgi:hypothetical protein
MTVVRTDDRPRRFLSTATAAPADRKIALAIAVAALLTFIAIVPFARTPLVKLPAFIPSYEAVLVFVDFLTALLLAEQFMRIRSMAILVLAAGYLFDALIIIPHALTFPGAFSAQGLLGAKEQTTAWLYVFWHGGFPLFVAAYVLLRRWEDAGGLPPLQKPWSALAAAIGAVAVLVCALTVVTIGAHDYLPVIVSAGSYALLVSKGVSPAVWLLTFVAMLLLWRKEQRLIDLWLMLVMWVWLFDIALSAIVSSSRFDLGWYSGRIFGLVAASFLLVTLVIELAQMYAEAISTISSAENRIGELMRGRSRPETQQTGKSTDAFVVSHNIARYHSLLEAGGLDETQRAAIRKLLDEEQAKLPPQT